MRMRILITATVFMMLIVSACNSVNNKGNDLLSDEYHAETDWQFFQTTAWGRYPKVQEDEGGCYFYHDHYVYRYDSSSGTVVPLCSKVNCLHDHETDDQKKMECNAYIDHLLDGGGELLLTVMLYKDNIYLCYQRDDSKPDFRLPFSIFRFARDGSSKEEIYRHSSIDLPVLHRGYVYFYCKEYTVEHDGKIKSDGKLLRINIEEKNIREELLVNVKEDTGLDMIRAYGNYVYFQWTQEGREFNSPRFVYDIRTGKIQETEFTYEQFTSYQGIIYEIPFESVLEDMFKPGSVYETDHLGRNPVPKITDTVIGSYLVSDEKYLYINNGYEHLLNPEKPCIFQVYDHQLQYIDSFTVPDVVGQNYQLDPPIGGKKYQYLVFDDEGTGEWGLYIWDKSEIGTLHGKAYTQKKVVYGDKE